HTLPRSMMHEGRRSPIAPLSVFLWRLAGHTGFAFAVAAVSLAMGMAGYSYFEKLGWRDAFLNAAMLLGGMGPVESPTSPGGKIFAGLYALYAGTVFLVAAGIVLAPVFHRFLHRSHLRRDAQARA